MARKNKMPGLYQRPDGYWQIDKRIRGFGPVRESTGTQDYTEAERQARARIAELEQAARYGVRMRHTFAEAAKKYLEENGHKRALDRDARDIAGILPWIGDMPLDDILIADLTPSLKREMRMNYHESIDGEGYFKTLTGGNGYVEIISYDKLLKDAARRNRVLFEKLGLHKN